MMLPFTHSASIYIAVQGVFVIRYTGVLLIVYGLAKCSQQTKCNIKNR